jgi:hypothetical protein
MGHLKSCKFNFPGGGGMPPDRCAYARNDIMTRLTFSLYKTLLATSSSLISPKGSYLTGYKIWALTLKSQTIMPS